MDTRTSSKHVTFRRPFTLLGLDGIQPAGNYVVRSEQELLDTLTCLGWRQMSLTIEILRDGATEHVAIDAQDLREALVRDGDQSTDPPAASTVAAGRERRPRNAMRSGGRP